MGKFHDIIIRNSCKKNQQPCFAQSCAHSIVTLVNICMNTTRTRVNNCPFLNTAPLRQEVLTYFLKRVRLPALPPLMLVSAMFIQVRSLISAASAGAPFPSRIT